MAGVIFMNNFLWRRHVRIERRLRDRLTNPLEEFSDEKCLHIFKINTHKLSCLLTGTKYESIHIHHQMHFFSIK